MARRKRIWITGATGFTGRHLVGYLRGVPEPLELIGLDCRAAPALDVDAFHEVDLTDLEALKAMAQSVPPDRVIHLAGLFPPAPEGELWRVNVGGTLNLLRSLALARNPALRIVSVGSAAEYLPSRSRRLREASPCGGHNLYGRTKWAQTSLALSCAREWNLHVCVARTFNLIGPGLSPKLVAGSLCEQFRRADSRIVKVGDVRPLRDFIDVRDAASAYWRICEHGRRGEVYNVCRGRATRIQTLLRHFAALSPRKKKVLAEPQPQRRGESSRVCGDNTKLRRLGWQGSIPLRQSVRDMLRAT